MAKEIIEGTAKDRLEKLMRMDRIQEAVIAAEIKWFPQNVTEINLPSSRILDYESILVSADGEKETAVHKSDILTKEQSQKLIERGVNLGKNNTSLKTLKR